VAEVKDGTIRCLTNAHCLGLDELAVADSLIDGIPDIVSYQLEVVFSNGKKAKVARMAEEKRGLDLAWLEVPEEGLTEGRDFLIVPQAKTQKLEIGNTVVAVGAPLGLKGSYTFGRVSALRTGNGGAFGRQWIQHDAAINPGNSGGPLFCETKAGYFCIGINTAKIRGGENLGFAIPLDAAFNGTYIWASADAAGAVKLLAENYNTRAVIVPK
jgi:S1-C subfamily serine protease